MDTVGHTDTDTAIAVDDCTICHGLEHIVRLSGTAAGHITCIGIGFNILNALVRITYRQSHHAGTATKDKKSR
ncbi:hypothetical protein SDC9_116429 [bioreactor metagenome]|uniref:Uncharacterized protein n=1 Tax=bioreactor metagenome TaxID=1076179 RepID=A0A645C6A5_9ZZZZ